MIGDTTEMCGMRDVLALLQMVRNEKMHQLFLVPAPKQRCLIRHIEVVTPQKLKQQFAPRRQLKHLLCTCMAIPAFLKIHKYFNLHDSLGMTSMNIIILQRTNFYRPVKHFTVLIHQHE